MKVKFSNLLTAFAAVFVLTLSAQAQEDLPALEIQDPTHSELNLDEDKTLIYDHPSHTSILRDSVQMAPRVAPAAAKMAKPEPHKGSRKEKDEEETLSFNFLYYMFQKFKMSDLIDQQ